MTEEQHQKSLFKWAGYARAEHPELGLMYHPPNESKRSVSQGGRLVATGMRRGVPDICLPVPRGGYGSLYIELKTERGRVTRDQREWIEALNKAGNYAVVAWGWENARAVILAYLMQT